MKSIGYITASCLITTKGYSITKEADRKPNIIIFYADDLGYGDLSCLNPDGKIPTPHLDRLASEGMTFTNAHSCGSVCTPSRYGLLTGRYHWRKFHYIVQAFGPSKFTDKDLTLPEMLKESGYTTGMIGKWHLGWNWAEHRVPGTAMHGKGSNRGYRCDAFVWDKPVTDGPIDHGFDTYFGEDVINFPPYSWFENDRLTKVPTVNKDISSWPAIKEGEWECRNGPMAKGWNPYEVMPVLMNRGIDFVKKNASKTKPFFLYYSFPSPHAPIIPNDEFDGKSKAGAYGDFVYQTDHVVGKILAELKKSGEADNTIIIFTSDNGPEYYCVDRKKNYDHWSSAPFRGQKRDIYEGGHHLPFIVKYPGVIKPGSVSNTLVSQTDIMATLASIVGHQLPEDPSVAEDSFDFLPVLTGEAKQGARTSMVHNCSKKHWAVRQGDWVLVNNELYNLADDIGQKNNLASKHPERVNKLKALLLKIKSGPSAPPRSDPER